jgi:hypothetical protein
MMLSFNIGQEMGSNEYIQKQSGNFIKTHKKAVMLPEKVCSCIIEHHLTFE